MASSVGGSRLADDAQLSIRMVDDEIVHVPTWRLSPAVMSETKPFRKFRWYKGQPHYSGSYWSSTESAHVVYGAAKISKPSRHAEVLSK
jgi:hypothetical protein